LSGAVKQADRLLYGHRGSHGSYSVR
jgi:hypothetical protein